MSAVLWWLLLFGVWPFADPGHTDLGSLMVWLDLALHYGAAGVLLHRYIERRARERAAEITRAQQ